MSISETKTDDSFLSLQFFIDSYNYFADIEIVLVAVLYCMLMMAFPAENELVKSMTLVLKRKFD